MPDSQIANFELVPAKVQEFLKLLRDNDLETEFLSGAPDIDAYPTPPTSDPSAGRLNAEVFGTAKTATARDLAASVERFAKQGSFLSGGTLVVDAKLVEYAKSFVERNNLTDRSQLARSLSDGDCEEAMLRRDCPDSM